jgi:hypothetical protein
LSQRQEEDILPVVRRTAALFVTLAWTAGGLCAQPVIGAKAGLVSYVLGRVSVDGRTVQFSGTRYPEVKENSVLRTGRGLAEVLLGPCSAVRLWHHSAFRLIASSPAHPRLELLGGSAVVEISGIARDSDVTLLAGGAAVAMARAGVYRVDLSPGVLKVFAGRATLQRDDGEYDVGAGRVWSLLGAAAGRFNRQPADELDRWSGRRSVVLAESRSAMGRGRGPSVDVLNSENSAEFARMGGGRRGTRGFDEASPAGTGAHRGAVLATCVAGR